jgi:hypothetical protein
LGTSSNQSSPKTPNWRIANAVLGNPSASPERQHEELWRAAIGDQGDALAEALGNPLLGNACALSARSKSPAEAIRQFDQSLLDSHNAGLILDLGKRALIRTVAAGKGAAAFAQELFAETISYYACRDLPSFVGAKGRISTTSDAIDLKDQIRNHARHIAKMFPVKTDPRGWKIYVSKVLGALQKGEQR